MTRHELGHHFSAAHYIRSDEEFLNVEEYARPIPVPDEITIGFWQAARHHRLAFQRCEHCGNFAHPPVQFCRNCAELDDPKFEFVPISGKGSIVNWTVMHDAMVVGFEPPWVNVLVEFPEQKHLFFVAILQDGVVPGLRIGAGVEVIFTDISEDISLPCFRLLDLLPS
jgi:uncharacterized OB-fold protein